MLCDAVNWGVPEIEQMCLSYIDHQAVVIFEKENLANIPKDVFKIILNRDSLSDELEEVQIYLAALKWARGTGSLCITDKANFSLEGISNEKLEELKEVIEAVRLPLIPAEIIIESIEKSSKFGTTVDLFSYKQLYQAMAYQAAP